MGAEYKHVDSVTTSSLLTWLKQFIKAKKKWCEHCYCNWVNILAASGQRWEGSV